MAKKMPSKRPTAATPSSSDEAAVFSVDTRLFRELGELLVGRESTALAELIKNAYDADARKVFVHAEGLAKADGSGRITVRDDGNGMSADTFRSGFLRIASRAKASGERRSPRLLRRFTGEKGVGRLAAHKLAKRLEVVSYFSSRVTPPDRPQYATGAIRGAIDWKLVESVDTVDQIPEAAVQLAALPTPRKQETGTKLVLSELRSIWTPGMIKGFVAECRGLTPDSVLTEPLSTKLFASKGLLGRVDTANAGTSTGFSVELAGDFVAHEEFSTSLAEKAILCLEIDCDATANLISYQVTPSIKQRDTEGLEQSLTRIPLDKALASIKDQYGHVPTLSFKARIFEAHGNASKWPDYAQGVRVFMEGFRVLPYGTKTDDWLSLKRDVIKRETSGFASLNSALGIDEGREDSDQAKKEALRLKGDHMYMGAVFLTHDGVPELQMLINREGFLPGAGIEALATVVRLGIQIATRQRFASQPPPPRPRGAMPEQMRAATKQAEMDSAPTVGLLLSSLERAAGALKSLELLPRDPVTKNALAQLRTELALVNDFADELFTEQAMIRVLASLGTHLSAFSHEIAHLLPSAKFVFDGVSDAAKALSKGTQLSAKDVRALKLVAIRHEAETLLRSLERQAVYLMDVSGTAARRRRSRQPLAERFGSAKRLFQGEIDRLKISMAEDLDPTWKTPPMFAAEVTMVLANLLSNAIKAAGKAGRIRVVDRSSGDSRIFRMENTGVRVDLADAEKWFKPFRSSGTDVDATLGQGMGLGLAITRSILDEYGVSISFVKPSAGFATATEIVFPAEN